MAAANRERLLSIQREDREAIDELLAVEGIDGVMIGLADLTQSYRIPTQMDHALIIEAVDTVAKSCAEHGKW